MKTRASILVIALAASFPFTTPAFPAPGSLDPTFGNGGKVTTDFGGTYDQIHGMVRQEDGKIIVAGTAQVGTFDFALARYHPDGNLDTSFGNGGRVATDFDGGIDTGRSVAMRPGGGIVVAGETLEGGTVAFIAVACYLANGTLDTSFNGNGKVITNLFGSNYGNGVAVQSDGKILVTGRSTGGVPFVLLRYNLNGTPDTSFNGNGRAEVPAAFNAVGTSVMVQPDGRILTAGYSINGGGHDFALTRHNPDGSLDTTTFTFTGKVTTDLGTGFAEGNGLALQPDGKILVAGFSFDGSVGRESFALVRYLANGILDTTLNGSGKVVTGFGPGTNRGQAVTTQADGKILVAGGAGGTFALVRYLGSGIPDTTFNHSGRSLTDFGTGEDSGKSVALQGDGRILLAGFSGNPADFALTRYSVAQADARLGPTPAATIGNNLYNLTGAGQVVSSSIHRRGGIGNTWFAIQNDGPESDSSAVRGASGNAKFNVRYLNGAANVTAAVVAGRWIAGPLEPGGSRVLKISISARTRLIGQKHRLGLTVTSLSDARGRDAATVNATSR